MKKTDLAPFAAIGTLQVDDNRKWLDAHSFGYP